MTTRRIAWRRDDALLADEHCTFTERDTGLALVGTVLGAEAGTPVRIEYRVLTDASGATSAVHVRDQRGFIQRTLTLERTAKGAWTIDGVGSKAAKALKGCADVDLGCSPSTNTLPIQRLRLRVGASKQVQVALVTFPELTVEKTAQTYERLDEWTYRFTSGTFQADLVVDEEGVVARYSDWLRTGVALGPEGSEPLDQGR